MQNSHHVGNLDFKSNDLDRFKISPEFSGSLDFIRALAAATVTIGHLRGGFFPAYNHLPSDSQNWINFLLFFVSRMGMEAVVIFFVLSGFLVGGGALIDLKQKKFSLLDYGSKRLSRMYVVLIPSLILGGIFDFCRITFTSDRHLIEHLNLNYFIPNLFFLQNTAAPAFGSNLPLWSLACEFWYYGMWSAIVFLLVPSGKIFYKFLCVVIVLLITTVICPGILQYFSKYFGIWVLGALIRLVPYRKSSILLFTSSLLLLIIALAASNSHATIYWYYILGFAFAFFLLNLRSIKLPDSPGLWRISSFFASFSFSLYALHYPFQAFLMAALRDWGGMKIPVLRADLLGWLQLFILMFIVYIYAWLVFFFTERNTYKVRKWMLLGFKRVEMRLNPPIR